MYSSDLWTTSHQVTSSQTTAATGLAVSSVFQFLFAGCMPLVYMYPGPTYTATETHLTAGGVVLGTLVATLGIMLYKALPGRTWSTTLKLGGLICVTGTLLPFALTTALLQVSASPAVLAVWAVFMLAMTALYSYCIEETPAKLGQTPSNQ